jgi:hypothetical protein
MAFIWMPLANAFKPIRTLNTWLGGEAAILA